eukprot:TRINITY_DN19737_c0_g1_i1.p2 TRINITY_DN19737_c0_g1~~TRINITY_DN19737_c0_g1_i1.p2  ORF type:complete len:198 (-),score=0.23 TRINITY_DN19737_c0_g1_i1:5-598(-)
MYLTVYVGTNDFDSRFKNDIFATLISSVLEHSGLKNKEKVLLLHVSEGDEAAFRQLYNDWQSHLSSFIFRITKSSDLTAEIVQDVFLKIWLNREYLSKVDNFKAYLFTVSRNYALNELRNSLRKLAQFQKWEKQYLEDLIEDAQDTKEFDLNWVDEAIDNLSERQKRIFLMHRHERLTYQQIADKLNIGKETPCTLR